MIAKYSRVDKRLDEWLNTSEKNDFPHAGGSDYQTRYKDIAKYLCDHIHPHTDKGAILEAIRDGHCNPDQIPYLNQHGAGHADTVIQRASELLEKSGCEITPYEGYILLAAIHLHDTGNVFGRTEHEKKCRNIMENMGKIAGDDTPEKRMIISISSVHGGLAINGTKDTISPLEEFSDLMGQQVRPRLLAAILRLADELADDSSRASEAPLELGLVTQESKIYHIYSRSLHSVRVEKTEIRLNYDLEEDLALEQFTKKREKIYLLDEIYSRALKVFIEKHYCMRFMRPHFNLRTVNIEIKVYPKGDLGTPIRISSNLRERGYPDGPESIFEMDPDLEFYTGEKVKEHILNEWRK